MWAHFSLCGVSCQNSFANSYPRISVANSYHHRCEGFWSEQFASEQFPLLCHLFIMPPVCNGLNVVSQIVMLSKKFELNCNHYKNAENSMMLITFETHLKIVLSCNLWQYGGIWLQIVDVRIILTQLKLSSVMHGQYSEHLQPVHKSQPKRVIICFWQHIWTVGFETLLLPKGSMFSPRKTLHWMFKGSERSECNWLWLTQPLTLPPLMHDNVFFLIPPSAQVHHRWTTGAWPQD